MNWKETKDKIIEILKQHGFSSQVDVRVRSLGPCKSINVVIGTPKISIMEIADLVKPFEEVKHDPNGKTTSGVFVEVTRDGLVYFGPPSKELIQAIDQARDDVVVEFMDLFIIGENQMITLASDKYAISSNLASMWKYEDDETIAKAFWKPICEHQLEMSYKMKKYKDTINTSKVN